MQTGVATPEALESRRKRRFWRPLGILLMVIIGPGHLRYCWSSTFRVRNDTNVVLRGVEVPLSLGRSHMTRVPIGDLLPGRSVAGTLPRFGEASVGVAFQWEGRMKEDCYKYIEGSFSHVEFRVASDGRVACHVNAHGGFILGWLNTL